MVQHLGTFGAAHAEANSDELDTFDWYGETIRISDRLAGAPLFEYAEAVVSDLDVKDMQAIAATKRMVQSCIVKDDWTRFWKAYDENRGTTEELAELSAALYQHLAGRPTDRPSDSSGGPSQTGNSLNGQSSTPQPSYVPLTTPGVTVQPGQTLVAVPDGNGGYTASLPDSLATSRTS